MKHYTSLLLLCLYVTANLCFASITDGDCAIARIPQMPSPQPAFKLRMFDKQFPRHNTINKGTKSMPSNSRLKSRECDGKFFKELDEIEALPGPPMDLNEIRSSRKNKEDRI